MSLTLKVRIGRKDTGRLPKSVVKALKLKPGRKVLVNVLGNIVTLQSLPDPLELVLTGRKFARISPEQIERASSREQRPR